MPLSAGAPASIAGLRSTAEAAENAIPAEPFELDDDFSGLACAEVGMRPVALEAVQRYNVLHADKVPTAGERQPA